MPLRNIDSKKTGTEKKKKKGGGKKKCLVDTLLEVLFAFKETLAEN